MYYQLSTKTEPQQLIALITIVTMGRVNFVSLASAFLQLIYKLTFRKIKAYSPEKMVIFSQ